MSPPDDALFIGVDLGTSGVRVVAASPHGELVGRAEQAYDGAVAASRGRHEQSADAWKQAVLATLSQVAAELGGRVDRLVAIAVDGTSGTIVPVDRSGSALRPAIMYNDPRATEEAAELTARAGPWCAARGYRIEASFAAAKIRWMRLREPEIFARTRWFLHHADYITAALSGERGITDFNNGLKTGYDLLEGSWAPWLTAEEGVAERLPCVVAPGELVGHLRSEVAAACGLPAKLAIVAGATDGTAGFLASGATAPGDDNSSLGTTLIFKRLATTAAVGAGGQVYSHKLPGGFWLPGAASNTGAAWMRTAFPAADAREWDQRAEVHLPSSHIAYPMVGTGERFPFVAAAATGFCVPAVADPLARYAAFLQGTALTERLGYEVLDRVVGRGGAGIFSTGAATRSNPWMQLRADVSGRCFFRPAHPEAAFGSAVLAASQSHFDSVWTAVEAMVRIEHRFEPDLLRTREYDEHYGAFTRLLAAKGYLPPD